MTRIGFSPLPFFFFSVFLSLYFLFFSFFLFLLIGIDTFSFIFTHTSFQQATSFISPGKLTIRRHFLLINYIVLPAFLWALYSRLTTSNGHTIWQCTHPSRKRTFSLLLFRIFFTGNHSVSAFFLFVYPTYHGAIHSLSYPTLRLSHLLAFCFSFASSSPLSRRFISRFAYHIYFLGTSEMEHTSSISALHTKQNNNTQKKFKTETEKKGNTDFGQTNTSQNPPRHHRQVILSGNKHDTSNNEREMKTIHETDLTINTANNKQHCISMASADIGLRIYTLHGTFKYLHRGGKMIDYFETEFSTAQQENYMAFCTRMCPCYDTLYYYTQKGEKEKNEDGRREGDGSWKFKSSRVWRGLRVQEWKLLAAVWRTLC